MTFKTLRSPKRGLSFVLLLSLFVLGCQSTSSDISPTLQAKLADDSDLISLVSNISGITNTYSDYLASLSASEKTKTTSRIKELANAGQINESMLTELSKLMGYDSVADYKAALNDIELSKRKLFEKFPELADGSHLAEVQRASEMTYDANALNNGSTQIQLLDKNCAGIYRSCTRTVAIAGAAAVLACAATSGWCIPLAVLATGAGLDYCQQQAIGCVNEESAANAQ